MRENFFKMVLTIIGVNSRIAQMLIPFIADILDKIIQRFLGGIWGKITGENASPTPTSATHNTPKNLHHPLPETIHTFATDFETKPHFREYVYTNTQRIFDIISLAINKILTPKFAITLVTLFIFCPRILDFFLPLSTITI